MNKQRKIYVVGDSLGYANWMEGKLVFDIESSDLVLFTGGEDVNPQLYNRKRHPTTGCNPERDLIEQKYFEQAMTLKKHCIGICRGSQFLCVMNGGILIQDQESQPFIHDIQTYDGKTLKISSTHHQAQYPFLLPQDSYKILGWTENLSSYHWGQNYQEELNPPKECEIVYYPKTKCLNIQGHPEYNDIFNHCPETIEYLRYLLNKFMEDKL